MSASSPAISRPTSAHHTEFQEKIQDRWPMPDSLSLAEVDEFVAERRGKYPVRWLRSGVADSQYAAAA
jgi:hypothetical protein